VDDFGAENEMIMMIAALDRDLRAAEFQVDETKTALHDLEKNISSVQYLLNGVMAAIKNLRENRPVVSLAEFKKLREEQEAFASDLEDMTTERTKIRAVGEKLKTVVAEITAKVQQYQHQLDTYQPPRTVLEFKPRDQQRNST